MVKTPDNTSQQVKDNPMMELLTALDPQGSGIYAQEAAGQRQLVESEVLPTEILHSTHEDFEALGFIFGEQVPGDLLFQKVDLPEGWKKEGSSHSMWSYVVDERGVRRVGVFYKAAFYDRRAHMNLFDVGNELSSDLIYADDSSKTIDLSVYTPEEIQGARENIESQIGIFEDAVPHRPEYYRARIERAREALAKLDALAQ